MTDLTWPHALLGIFVLCALACGYFGTRARKRGATRLRRWPHEHHKSYWAH